MACVAVGHKGAAAAGGSHGRHKLHIHHVAEDVVAAVPAVIVHVLPQELDRGLYTGEGRLRGERGGEGERGGGGGG